MTTPLLDVRDLTVGFHMPSGFKEVVHGINLSVPQGGATALVGESGSGKSVSMRGILGLLPSNARVQGSAVLDNLEGKPVDLTALDEPRKRGIRGARVGLVFQNAMEAFNPSLTVEEQLVEALLWHGLCDRSTARKRAVEAMDDVGIPEAAKRVKMYPFQLSGGMRQRAMIAMATIARPELIVADEPTTALDVTVQKQILDLMADLRAQGMGILMITHDLGVARYVCDDVVVLREGHVAETAPVEQLLTQPKSEYSKVLVDAALDVGYEVPDRPPLPPDEPQPILQARNLTKVFAGRAGDILAVEDVSFDILPGRTLGVVGESGSGKSTLARLALHLLEPTEGEVEFDGDILGKLGNRRLRQKRRDMQMVFQSPYGSLLPGLTVAENIGEPLRINKLADKRERRSRAADLLELVEMDVAYLDMYPRQISGGQQQRVAIARALALEPKFLVADEPTSALDASVQVQVLDLLQELQAKLGFAMMLITHNLAVAERLSDHLLVMRAGKEVEMGETQSVFLTPEEEYTRRLLSAILPVRAQLDAEPTRTH